MRPGRVELDLDHAQACPGLRQECGSRPQRRGEWFPHRTAVVKAAAKRPDRLAAVIEARTDVVGSLLRPPELLAAAGPLRRGQAIEPAALKRPRTRPSTRRSGSRRRPGSRSSPTVRCAGCRSRPDCPTPSTGSARCRSTPTCGATGTATRSGTFDRPADRPWSSASGSTVATTSLPRSSSTCARAHRRSRRSRSPARASTPTCVARRRTDAYPTLDDFLADVVAITRQEIDELVRLGCTYIQLDAPHYPLLIDPDTRAFYESRGWTVERWIDHGIELDNAVIDEPPRRHVWIPSVPRQPGQPVAGVGRLRADRPSGLPRASHATG